MPNSNQPKKKSVLIVEDEAALLDIYSTKLEAEGFTVLTAENGVIGLNTAIQQLPSIILLDVMLPAKDGFDVLRDLKANPKTKDIPVIILSNLGQAYEIKRGLDLGAEEFLTKANTVPSKVVQKVRAVLNKKA